eukprot:2092186-Karenia_brevis.AAC.1
MNDDDDDDDDGADDDDYDGVLNWMCSLSKIAVREQIVTGPAKKKPAQTRSHTFFTISNCAAFRN